MSEVNISSIKYISGEDLSKVLLSPDSSSVAVIDVRDLDREGGHIKGSVNVTVDKLDWRLPELVRTLKDKDLVVFHCQMSQQRGPRAALEYMRERKRIDGENQSKQKVAVLRGGFQDWQKKYAQDERLTEAYDKDFWDGVMAEMEYY